MKVMKHRPGTLRILAASAGTFTGSMAMPGCSIPGGTSTRYTTPLNRVDSLTAQSQSVPQRLWSKHEVPDDIFALFQTPNTANKVRMPSGAFVVAAQKHLDRPYPGSPGTTLSYTAAVLEIRDVQGKLERQFEVGNSFCSSPAVTPSGMVVVIANQTIGTITDHSIFNMHRPGSSFFNSRSYPLDGPRLLLIDPHDGQTKWSVDFDRGGSFRIAVDPRHQARVYVLENAKGVFHCFDDSSLGGR